MPACGGLCGSNTKALKMEDPDILDKVEAYFQQLQSAEDCESLLNRHLTPEIFDKLKGLQTQGGATLLDVIRSGVENLDSAVGVYAPDPDSYTVFADLFNPIIEDYHEGFRPKDKHPDKNFGDINSLIDFETQGHFVVSTRVRCVRSIQGYPFSPLLSEAQYKEIEGRVTKILSSLTGELKGTYYPLSGMEQDVQNKLKDSHFLFTKDDRLLEAARAHRFWPVGRGIFHNDDKTFLVYVNEEDHLRFFSIQQGGNLASTFKRLVEGISAIEKSLPFAHSDRLGYLTFCPTNLGTTIRASVHIKLPKLAQDKALLDETCSKFHLQVQGKHGEHDLTEGKELPPGVYNISNKRRLGLTEFQAVKEMEQGILELIKIEKNMELS